MPRDRTLGATEVTFTATDSSGHQAVCRSLVTVQDTKPPVLNVYVDPASLWPPNHELIPVHVQWVAQDACTPTPSVELLSVTSSEPDDVVGNDDGATTGDIEGMDLGTPDSEVIL